VPGVMWATFSVFPLKQELPLGGLFELVSRVAGAVCTANSEILWTLIQDNRKHIIAGQRSLLLLDPRP
jgi:hypothetical protein